MLAVGARASADQIGTQTTQIAAITADPDWQGGDYHASGRAPRAGLAVARRIAHLTYRTEHELDARFGNEPQIGEDPLNGGRYAIASYLEHQATKLVDRFDAGTYVLLSEAMNRHDVGRGRGGLEAALGSVRTPTIVGGVDSDRLYPLRQQQEIADLIPGATGCASSPRATATTASSPSPTRCPRCSWPPWRWPPTHSRRRTDPHAPLSLATLTKKPEVLEDEGNQVSGLLVFDIVWSAPQRSTLR